MSTQEEVIAVTVSVSRQQLRGWFRDLRGAKRRINDYVSKTTNATKPVSRTEARRLLKNWRPNSTPKNDLIPISEKLGGKERLLKKDKFTDGSKRQQQLWRLCDDLDQIKLDIISHFIGDYLKENPQYVADLDRMSFCYKSKASKRQLNVYFFTKTGLSAWENALRQDKQGKMPEPHGHLVVDFGVGQYIYWRPVGAKRGSHNFDRLILKLDN